MHEIQAVNADCFFLWKKKLRESHTDIRLAILQESQMWHVSAALHHEKLLTKHRERGKNEMWPGHRTFPNSILDTLMCAVPRLKQPQPTAPAALTTSPRNPDHLTQKYFQLANASSADFPPVLQLLSWGSRQELWQENLWRGQGLTAAPWGLEHPAVSQPLPG